MALASPARVVVETVSPSLLAVDLGLRTGLALYGDDGRLRWYRSRNYGSVSRLKRGAWSELMTAAPQPHPPPAPSPSSGSSGQPSEQSPTPRSATGFVLRRAPTDGC